MLILSIVGKSKSGKTTLIEKLILELKSRGLRVGTVKHAHHGFELDHPGKDSFRHREAGAEVVALSSKDKIAIQRIIQKEMPLNEIIQTYFPDELDLVLVEGFKDEPSLKIEVDEVKDIDINEIADVITKTRDGSQAKARSVPSIRIRGTLLRLASEPSLKDEEILK